MSRKILVWFRNDLRLHDNEMLVEAVAKADEILPVYIFDPRYFEKTPFNTYKTGITRTKFLLESVASLRKSLGGKLLIAHGMPKDILPDLVAKYQISEVYHHREVAHEETTVSTNVEDALWKLKINLKHFIGHTLYNKEDLPFPIKDIPDDFLKFKKKIEREALVKPSLDAPSNIKIIATVKEWGELPDISKILNIEETEIPTRKSDIEGGEQKSLIRLRKYLETVPKGNLKKHEMISKLSPWISIGCLSPRLIYWKIKEAENQNGSQSHYQQLLIGLLWRDYYRFMLKKYSNSSLIPLPHSALSFEPNTQEMSSFEQWKTGTTSNLVVNRLIKELHQKGYVSFTERQLIASYLLDELKVNWVLGATYFEEICIDYCPASNWGNWINLTDKRFNKKSGNETSFQKLLKLLDPKNTILEVV